MKRLMFVILIGILIIVSIGAAPADAAGAYRVRRGDTLTGIARRYGISVAQLARANGLSTSSWVYTGQVLTIPSSGRAPGRPPAPGRAPGSGYIVQRGDTLTGIARHFGVSVAQLARANGLSTRSWVYTGQFLAIPS